jgi:hypothetical protein
MTTSYRRGAEVGEISTLIQIQPWERLRAMKSVISPLRIQGRSDRVIPLPIDVDAVLDGGHLERRAHARGRTCGVCARVNGARVVRQRRRFIVV